MGRAGGVLCVGRLPREPAGGHVRDRLAAPAEHEVPGEGRDGNVLLPGQLPEALRDHHAAVAQSRDTGAHHPLPQPDDPGARGQRELGLEEHVHGVHHGGDRRESCDRQVGLRDDRANRARELRVHHRDGGHHVHGLRQLSHRVHQLAAHDRGEPQRHRIPALLCPEARGGPARRARGRRWRRRGRRRRWRRCGGKRRGRRAAAGAGGAAAAAAAAAARGARGEPLALLVPVARGAGRARAGRAPGRAARRARSALRYAALPWAHVHSGILGARVLFGGLSDFRRGAGRRRRARAGLPAVARGPFRAVLRRVRRAAAAARARSAGGLRERTPARQHRVHQTRR
mmetsp:Transcript_4555/g.18272  ORF Transcript_4555/g.18272 Transcript_4555/m.18272 type:complete len:343 (-) Transcript_4555:641-1669(-)